MAGVINDMATMVYGLKQFAGRRLRVEIADDEPLFVEANVTEMKQIMLNLIVNALEAVPAGSGQIVISAIHLGKTMELTVSDNGRGMTQQTLDQIFEPFYTNKRGVGAPGTGLGLSITHAIITNHGGQIRAESDGLGRGSRFIVQLPIGNMAGAPIQSFELVHLQETAS